jgi:hypothetical protein
MSIRVRYKFIPSISSDANEARDLGNPLIEVYSDALVDGGSFRATVPALATNLQIAMPGIANVSFLAIRATSTDSSLAPVTVNLTKNSPSGEVIALVPFGGKESLLVLTTSGITSIYASNPSTTTSMDLTFYVAGN